MIENPFFERHKDFDIDYSDILPHWHQWGKMQYITFRLADSLPQSKIAVLKQIRADFEANNPRPWDEQTKRNFYKILSPYESRMLDAGFGSCVLANKEARQVLERVLQKFNGDLYEIVAYVIMPNHVHIVMIMNENNSPDVAMRHIWQHSTYHINRTIGQHGALWQKTYYDHIVRNAESLKHFVKYIYNNPQKLPKENYSIYRNENLVDSFGNWIGKP